MRPPTDCKGQTATMACVMQMPLLCHFCFPYANIFKIAAGNPQMAFLRGRMKVKGWLSGQSRSHIPHANGQQMNEGILNRGLKVERAEQKHMPMGFLQMQTLSTTVRGMMYCKEALQLTILFRLCRRRCLRLPCIKDKTSSCHHLTLPA